MVGASPFSAKSLELVEKLVLRWTSCFGPPSFRFSSDHG
jgi:hypothetical protein